MRAIACWTLVGVAALGASARAEDCALGQRYLSLAQDRIAAFANDDAMAFLRQSVDACPTYDAYEQLGELAAQSPQREDKVKAVEAFIAAHARAPSPQTQARSLYQYAALLNREGDPQNAYPLVKEAHTLDPGNADITDLAGKVEAEVQHPTQEHIVRALKYSLYQPISAPLHESGGSGHPSATGSSTPKDDHLAAARAAAATGPSVNIPINFETARVAPDVQTRPNIDLLAHSLADPSLQGKQFRFIGHTDQRGEAQFNDKLSLDRAQAISDMVVSIEPALKGHIKVEGHGAREPIDAGTDPKALRANRRLQVLVID
jgi:outer membrane protein OmpA-like peptidoglycan-associated protein